MITYIKVIVKSDSERFTLKKLCRKFWKILTKISVVGVCFEKVLKVYPITDSTLSIFPKCSKLARSQKILVILF